MPDIESGNAEESTTFGVIELLTPEEHVDQDRRKKFIAEIQKWYSRVSREQLRIDITDESTVKVLIKTKEARKKEIQGFFQYVFSNSLFKGEQTNTFSEYTGNRRVIKEEF